MLVDVAVAALVHGTSTDPSTEGVPEWLTYLVTALLGSPVVLALGWVIVRALAKRLGVQADTPGGTPETGATSESQPGPEQGGPKPAPAAERYDAQMAIIEQAFQRQDKRLAELSDLAQRQAALIATVTAERDRLAWMYEEATGRPAPGPPPPIPPGWSSPSPGSLPGS